MSPSSTHLGQQLRTGALWSYLQGWIGSVIQFGAGIILARLLAPDEFGVFFAVSAYTVFLASQIKFGIPESLLQATKLEEDQWNSAFWIMEGVALLSMIIVFLGAPWLSDFYGDDRYLGIAYLLALSFPVIPFMSINGTLLRRRMDFKTVGFIQIKASFLGTGASLLTAFLGFGPYCFVAGGLTGTLVSSYLMARSAPWHPAKTFRFSAFKSLFAYAWRIHLNNSIFTLSSRIDNMIMGKLMGLSALGVFMRAKSLAFLPITNIVTPIYQLAFSGFSRIQHDSVYSRQMHRKILCATTSAVYPLLVLFLFLGEGLIFHLYGEKWLPATLPFKLLTLGIFFSVITNIAATLAEANNLVSRQTPIEITNLILTVMAVIFGARWGLGGIAMGFTIKMLIINMLTLRLLKRSHLVGNSELVHAIYPAVTSCFAAATTGLLATVLTRQTGLEATDLLYMFTLGSIISITYLGVWTLLVRLDKNNEALQANYQLAQSLVNKLAARIRIIK